MKHNTSIETLETRIAPATVFGVNSSNGLFSFDSDTPGTLSATTAITGLAGGEIVRYSDSSARSRRSPRLICSTSLFGALETTECA